MTTSLLDSLVELPEAERRKVLDELDDETAALLLWDWTFWARAEQLPPPGDWAVWLVLAGRGFGKTRVGAEWTREQVREYEFVNLVGPTAADVRDVMVKGESGVLAVCPPWERPTYHSSTRSLTWPNGAKSLTFSAEDPEQLRGPQHMRLWCDEIAAWSNHTRDETWDLAMLGLRLGDDPRALATTTPKPVPLLRALVEDPNVMITKGSTYDNRDNLAPKFYSQLITKYEGTRFGRQELEAELLLDEGLAYRVAQGVHVIPPMEIPAWWGRFEGFDHGSNNPAAWLCFASDDDGNHVAHAAYYKPGLVSDHSAAILKLRESAWGRDEQGNLVSAPAYADPSIKNRMGVKDWKGREISVELEYADHGLTFAAGQNDRRAGYLRLSELLKEDPARTFPAWHPKAGELGAPRLYILDTTELQPLVEQLRDAPLEDVDSPLSRFPGEAVDEQWEGSAGHAHAAARYALMSRPSPSAEPVPEPDDPRAALLQKVERRREQSEQSTRYDVL